ncbi:hypothetical protein Agabi119p4_5349 [Agaricus bisporus var. burnettii]|uniref:Uncharacterized protein n=1 Tax=Agaricus bisporus var. burnettii TaxID=192524 RepID=A0A8H7F1I2_AGABI|nr:hypothetical protein Agabi119p4_5349 [Agaricus bisporus var. burnettii]
MEAPISSAPKLKGMLDRSEPPHSPRRAPRRMSGNRSSLRAERYRRAEAQLTQSLRRCGNEPSIFDLQIRTLRQATSSLAQFAEESGHRAKELTSLTADRTAVADIDPECYRSMLSQRWKAERQHHSISQHVDVLQQTITSLVTVSSSARDVLSQGGNDINHVSGPDDKVRTNLVSFLSCPQRVTPIHRRRPRSRFLKAHLRPLNLGSLTACTTPTMALLRDTIPTCPPEVESSSDSSVDTGVRTPLATESLVEPRQLELQIKCGEEVGTAVILTQPLPPPIPLDPSNVKVELPAYVHELLSDFDTQAQGQAAPATPIFDPERPIDPVMKSGFWPFKARPKDQEHVKSYSQGAIRSRSSLMRLSELLPAPEMLSLRRKDNTRENRPGEEVISNSRSSFSTRATRKTNSKASRRFSFAKFQFGQRT